MPFYEGCDFRFFDYIKTQLGLQTGLHFYTPKTSNNNNPNILCLRAHCNDNVFVSLNKKEFGKKLEEYIDFPKPVGKKSNNIITM